MGTMTNRGLFLDRDGVINIDHGYVYQRERFEFVPGVLDLGRAAVSRGYHVFVVTNQTGIGRGYFTEREFLALTEWMRGVFARAGAAIAEVYYCPTHPEFGVGAYQVESPFRKPNPGMILEAAAEFGVDLPASVLVGDKERDIAAGAAAGVGCNLLYCPDSTRVPPESAATAVVATLADVVPYLG